MGRLADLLSAQAGTITLDADQGSGQSEETSSTSTSSDREERSSASDQDVDLSSLPREKILAFLERDPDFRKEAARSVRKKEISRQVQEQLESALNAKIKEFEVTTGALSQQNLQLLSKLESQAMENMSDAEKAVYEARKEATLAKNRASQLEARVTQSERERYREDILQFLRDEAEMDEGVLEDLAEISDDDEFVANVVKATARTSKLSRAEKAKLQAQLAGKTRQDDGTSVYAASTPAASGGAPDFKSAEQAWLKDPGNPRVAKRYYDLRKELGIGQ